MLSLQLNRIAPDYLCMDGTIPRARLPEVLERMDELAEYYGLSVANVFHAGGWQNPLHPLILHDASKEGDVRYARRRAWRGYFESMPCSGRRRLDRRTWRRR